MTSAGEAASHADCHDNRHSAVATATVTCVAPLDRRLLRLKRAPRRLVKRSPGSRRPKSRSFTRSRSASFIRSPAPYSNPTILSCGVRSRPRIARTSSGSSTTGTRFRGEAGRTAVQPRPIHFQNMSIQEENAVQGLILGTRRNMTVDRQMTQVRLDLLLPQP